MAIQLGNLWENEVDKNASFPYPYVSCIISISTPNWSLFLFDLSSLATFSITLSGNSTTTSLSSSFTNSSLNKPAKFSSNIYTQYLGKSCECSKLMKVLLVSNLLGIISQKLKLQLTDGTDSQLTDGDGRCQGLNFGLLRKSWYRGRWYRGRNYLS